MPDPALPKVVLSRIELPSAPELEPDSGAESSHHASPNRDAYMPRHVDIVIGTCALDREASAIECDVYREHLKSTDSV